MISRGSDEISVARLTVGTGNSNKKKIKIIIGRLILLNLL